MFGIEIQHLVVNTTLFVSGCYDHPISFEIKADQAAKLNRHQRIVSIDQTAGLKSDRVIIAFCT